MAVAHAAEIIHRDLKPGNLFVQLDGLLKLLDFGVARLASSSMTTAGAQPGTLHYMSPEQARGDEIDKRSDIFSAGSVFYFMLTGRKPFPGQEWARVIRMLESEDPQPLDPGEAPPALANIVMRCLAKQAAARYRRLPERGGRSDQIPTSVPGGDETTAGNVSARRTTRRSRDLPPHATRREPWGSRRRLSCPRESSGCTPSSRSFVIVVWMR